MQNSMMNTNMHIVYFSLTTQVQQSLGYCPQFDALIDQMTGEETLYMYARLRGIENSQIPGVIQSLIDTLMLKKHAKKKAGVYRLVYYNIYKTRALPKLHDSCCLFF